MDPIEATLLMVYFITASILNMSRKGDGDNYQHSDSKSDTTISIVPYRCGTTSDNGKAIDMLSFSVADTKEEMV